MRNKLRSEVGEIVTNSTHYNCKAWGDYLRREIGLSIEEKEKRFMDALGKLSMDIDILRRDVDALVDHLGLERVVTPTKLVLSETTYKKKTKK